MARLPHSVTNVEENDIVRARSGERTVSGRANPVAYQPGESIEIEIRTEDHDPIRYKLHSTYANGEWEPLTLERCVCRDGARGWEPIGTVEDVTRIRSVRDIEENVH
ncbi:hypothetical protein [Natronorarus salvus]|uniref:hypothetical protein n=1 Tax=Natronorarus salvus TaxID=3117733 RepID=UPI002F2645CD